MSKFQNAYVITGTIGSGKSTVCRMLKLYGFKIIDADEISHEILKQSSHEITAEFGEDIAENGEISRVKLGNIVFKDSVKLKWLESLLHPKIKAEILRQSKILEKYNAPYMVDIPLFFEKNSYTEFENIVVVYAPTEILVSRVSKRNSLTKEEALARVSLQIDIEKKREKATYIIDNSGNLAALNSEVEKFIRSLK